MGAPGAGINQLTPEKLRQLALDKYSNKSIDELAAEKAKIEGLYDTYPERNVTNDPGYNVVTELLNQAVPGGGITSGTTPTNNPTLQPTPLPNISPIPSTTSPTNALPSAPITATSPQGGIVGTVDENRLLAEAELQKQLSAQTLEQQTSARKQYLTDLSNLLQEQQRQQLSTELPGIYEDLNTRGLLRSSDLGNRLSMRQADLARQTSSELARQGLSYNDEYTRGLGGIQDAYLGARSSAIQRGFSLSDYQRQLEASKQLGFALQPTPQPSNGKSGQGLNSGLAGAAIGSKFGVPGALVGGTAAAVGGSVK